MPTHVIRLQPPRADFAQTLTDAERDLMGRHAAHWQPYVESGRMVVFGPVADEETSWGLGVVETDDEAALRAHAAADPVNGTCRVLVGTLLAGFVRGTSQA